MKKRILALLLLFTLILAPAAQASQAMGWELHKTVTVLGEGLTLTDQIFWGDSRSDYRRERVFTYTPNPSVTPQVIYGATVPAKTALTTMAKDLESYGYRVLGGANGDYFVMNTGVPLGLVVTWGTLRSSSSYHQGVGFLPDGTAFVGKPEVQIWSEISGVRLLVTGGYNKTREKDGYALFSPDFGAATSCASAGLDLVLRPVVAPEDYAVPEVPPTVDEETGEEIPPTQEALDAALAAAAAALPDAPAALFINAEPVTCVVEAILPKARSSAIPAGRFVLSLSDTAPEYHRGVLGALRVGEQVKLSATAADERWGQAVTALGAYERIVENGVVPSGLATAGEPRTALGIRADGTVLLYTMDGRRSGYSVGAGVNQVAKRLVELECVDAVLLDGGGSTTLGATDALADKFTLQNKPSGGSQRAVSNAIFFLSNLKPTGETGSLYLEPHGGMLLPGAQVSLSAQEIDTGYYPLHTVAPEVTYTAQGPGEISGSVLTATGEKGTVTVTGTTPAGVSGETLFTVIPTPHTITVSDGKTGEAVSGLNFDPGESVDLTASAAWYKLPLQGGDSCFTWACDAAIGTIDALGRFTAGEKGGTGNITVSAGEKSVKIPVSVAGHVIRLEDMEGENVPFESASPDGESASAQIRLTTAVAARGRQALEVTYTPDAPAGFAANVPIPAGESCLGAWVWGDGSPTRLEVTVELSDGSAASAVLSWGGFEGWRVGMATLPEGAVRVTGFTLFPGEGATGKLYLDHLVSANQAVYDTAPPTGTVSVSGGVLTAKLKDNVDKTFDPAHIVVTVDGKSVPFTLNGSTLTATLPGGTGIRRAAVTVSDAWGNLGRLSWYSGVPEGYQDPFVDVSAHWAAEFAWYLYDLGITTGTPGSEGLCFLPESNITRAEFAAMLCRWLGTEIREEGELPFADGEEIPSWATGSIRTLYTLGIFNGSQEGDSLYAHPGASLTRAEAAAMLGRVQEKGYAVSAQLFQDDGDIPAWAREHVYTLAGQGVIGGYQGLFRPTDPITRGETAKILATLR